MICKRYYLLTAYNGVSRRVSLILPDDLYSDIRNWAKTHNESSLIYGIRISTALRELIKRGIENDRRKKE